MEKNEKQIICHFDKNFIHSIFFAYLDINEKTEIIERLEKGSSVVVGFQRDEQYLFFAVIDIHADCIHVRQYAGQFTKGFSPLDGYEFLNKFCAGFAKFVGVKEITTRGGRLIHEKIYRSFGFVDNGNGDYSRAIH